jgi:DNA-binding transcriptional LysR family regulator
MSAGAISTALRLPAAAERQRRRLASPAAAKAVEGGHASAAGRGGARAASGGQPMEMQQIRYFLALSKSLNFTRAAEMCNVSQPALTRAIQALEAELGGDLIRRERGNSHLTPLGQRMLPFMQQCYDAAVGAHALARAVQSSDVAPLNLGLSCSINTAAFMQPISELFRAYPGIQLKIRRGAGDAIGAMLKNGDIELAIAGPLDESWERLDRWPIFAEPMSVTVHMDHRLARQNDVTIEHLSGERFLTLVGCEMAKAQLAYLTENGVSGVSTHEVDSDHDLVALLEANAGVAVMPASAPRSAVLCRPMVRGWRLQRDVSVYGVSGRQRAPVATTLLNLLRAADWTDFESGRPAATN